jgi:hypothetical protein
MIKKYAADTAVPVHRSRQQMEAMLQQHGAAEFAYGWDSNADKIQFTLQDRTIRFTLPRVKKDDYLRKRDGTRRSNTQQENAYQQAERQRWRALYLVVRAKLEAVESGIALFEQEFLAFIVMPNGLTIGDVLVPQLPAITSGSTRLLDTSER